MLSRGSLSLDVRPEKFARIQQAIIVKCNLAGKPVIVTRMLDSMVLNPQASRCADFVADLTSALSFKASPVRPDSYPDVKPQISWCNNLAMDVALTPEAQTPPWCPLNPMQVSSLVGSHASSIS